jgi:D-3-phosphoglycerate dehydrogenase / 2-oxoglutarate reductase
MTILLLEPIHPDAQQVLQEHDELLLAPSSDGLHDVPHQAVTAILTRGRGRVTRELIARCPHLRAVARCGVGLDNVDRVAAHEHGVAVVYAPGSTTAARNLQPLANAVAHSDWAARDGYEGVELRGKTLGILGLGDIGRRVAALASAFGMSIVYWSQRSRDERYTALSFDEVLGVADVVSVHAALTPETRHLLGARELALLKPGAILVNTARGGIIDQQALLAALDEGRLRAFAADVLADEPPAPDDPLLGHPRALITPHVAAITDVTYRAMCVSTAHNVLALLRGEEPDPRSLYRP